jgi:MoaA/NifB/PqqE/SkfB family radical SAM enzyme
MTEQAVLPPGFDPELYISLHPDLAAAGLDGTEHYLNHGFFEGRSYRKMYHFYIDVFSHCNLRCPSCPVGNKYGNVAAWPRGLMAPEYLGKILDKARSECEIVRVGLFNWTEPLLHPNLPSLVREVKSRNLFCSLSSNLNVLRDPERLLVENPDYFRISLSGFTQPVYEIGHREGNIEVVKRNMEHLAKAHAATGRKTQIEVYYHRYLHNVDEVAPMEEFSRSLGFEFSTHLAYMMPVEKIIAFSEGRATPEDEKIIARFALPLDRALEITSREQRSSSCTLLDDVIALDVSGNVMLCCGSSMESDNVIANFLEFPLEELQRRRGQKVLCQSCMKLGIPDYFFQSSPELHRIAAETIAAAKSSQAHSSDPEGHAAMAAAV